MEVEAYCVVSKSIWLKTSICLFAAHSFKKNQMCEAPSPPHVSCVILVDANALAKDTMCGTC